MGTTQFKDLEDNVIHGQLVRMKFVGYVNVMAQIKICYTFFLLNNGIQCLKFNGPFYFTHFF
jgi:hypothetical protein